MTAILRMKNHNYLGTWHLLLGLLHAPDPFVVRVFKSLALDPAQVRSQVLVRFESTDKH